MRQNLSLGLMIGARLRMVHLLRICVSIECGVSGSGALLGLHVLVIMQVMFGL